MSETTATNAPVTQTKPMLEETFINVGNYPQYVTDTGKILPRKYTGLTAKEQRHFSKLVKQARHQLVTK